MVSVTIQSIPITVTVQDQAPVVLTVSSAQGTAGISVPAGGTTGQVLAKKSNTDYDYEWITLV